MGGPGSGGVFKQPFEWLYNQFKLNTRHTVLLSYEEFVEFTHEVECHYCGSPIVWAAHTITNKIRNVAAYNLDRKDSNGPYSKDNCVVCCKRCNLGKGHMFAYSEWKQIGALIRSWKHSEICG